ncbi:hypothetical protein ACQPUY_17765 [Clostridium nigeriense]|uniref:hypothetical protein n=1 Tax=Clostridium nigeriense TaxID=1805470 RepID=UPI003D32AB09
MIEFDDYGRMKYNPELHPNQGEPWSYEDTKYLIDWLEIIGYEEMSLALGRTEITLRTKVCRLRKDGLMEIPNKKIYHQRLLRRCDSEQVITY